MGFFRRKRSAPPKPLDFRFFDDAEWARFDACVHDSLQRLGIDVEGFEPGAVDVRGHGTLGLLNVAQNCHASPPDDWPAILDEHFAATMAGLTGSGADDVLDTEQLKVRLLPDDYGPPELMADAILNPFAESVNAALVFDLPTTIRMTMTTDLGDLGLDVAEAWDLAWEQTRRTERPDEHDVVEIAGVPIHSLLGESFFVASLVKFLPELVGDLGPNGALVSIPRRHTILAHTIHDLSAAQAVQAMVPDTRRLYVEGPGPVSAHLYWWRDGSLTWLPIELDDERMAFYPPPEFVDMLNSLAAPER